MQLLRQSLRDYHVILAFVFLVVSVVETFSIVPRSATRQIRGSNVPPPLWATRHDDGLSRGDSKGAAVVLDQVAIYRGPARIIQGIDWRVEPNAKWGLVGANGVGKSTLLKAIMEEILYDGTITVGTTQTVGYLQQTAVAGSTLSVFDEASSAMRDIQAAREALHQAEATVAAHDNSDRDSSLLEEDLKILEKAQQRFVNVGGYQQEKEVAELLNGLGFTNLTQPCNELSGGWQMRVSFAKLLLSKPSLCLLDEPSNHLDRSARAWLANYLKQYDNGAMILVTHDKELLHSCEHMAEITSAGTLQTYKSCTYEQYLDLKKERSQQAMTEYEKNKEKAAKLQAFVDRFGASATKASAAQSRVKQLEKMQQLGLLEEPPQDVIQERFRPRLNLPDPPKAKGDILLALKDDAMVGYHDDLNGGSTIPLISQVNLEICRGMKILVRGPNGSGKSTLLHTLRGELPLLQGKRMENEHLRLGVFTQDLAQELDVTERAVDLVTAYARNGHDGDITISSEQARTVMGGLGLTGDKALRRVGELSGGEKARVALAMFALKPSNLYLLDEVSNHCDMECVEALSESLSVWGGEDDSKMGTGALVVISHDKSFCEQVGFTHVLTIQKDGTLKLEQRNTNESDWDSSGSTVQRSQASSLSDSEIAINIGTASVELDAKDRKRAYNAPKRISKIEALVERKEEEIAALDEEMLANGSDVGKLVDLTKEKEALEAEVMELMEEWEELETLLASVEAAAALT